MSSGGLKTIRFVNTGLGEGNNQLVLLDPRVGGGNLPTIPPVDLPDRPAGDGGCSDDPLNTVCGFNAGINISSGTGLTLFGVEAGSLMTTTTDKVAIGHQAMSKVSTNMQSTAVGFQCQANQQFGNSNTSVGYKSMFNSDSTTGNTTIGNQTLQNVILGSENTCVGGLSMANTQDSMRNVAIGFNSLKTNVSGDDNVCLGWMSGFTSDGGDDNIFLGSNSGSFLDTGDRNILIGKDSAISYTTSESDNIIIGTDGDAAESKVMRLGDQTNITSCFIGGIKGVTPAGSTEVVIIDTTTGEMGSEPSGGGTGDVVGPASAVDGEVALFDGITGKLLKAGQIQMDGAGGMTEIVSMEMTNVVTADDTVVQLLDVDAAGFAPVTALGIALSTGAIDTGDTLTASLNVIDQDESLGGRVFGNSVFSTSTGSATVHGLGASVNVNPIFHQSGTHIDADSLDNNGSDVTTALSQGGAGNITMFANDNDDFTIGSASKFSETEFILDIDATNGGILPLFEFSTGIGTFDSFSPQDGTSGMRSSGTIQWDVDDLVGWAVDGNTEFTIRITRTRNTINTPPRADLVQIASTTVYEWNEFGDVNIRGLNVSTNVNGTDSVVLEGTGTTSGWNCDFNGLIDIDSSAANTAALSLKASGASGGILLSALTGGIEQTCSGPFDIHTSVDMAGTGITIRSTGTAGRIEMDSGTGGVRIIDGGTGLFIEDTSSLFAIQFAVPTMAADYKLTYPSAQGTTDGQALVNNSSGVLRWDNPAAAFPEGWIFGLGIVDSTDAIIDIVAGNCRDVDDTFNIVIPSTLSPDITTSGANGLDTGSAASDTWYAVHVIADTSLSSIPAALFSLSISSPTLPGTYDVFRRIGFVRLDGSTDLYKAFRGQNGLNRSVIHNEFEPLLEVLTDGSATVYTSVDCSEWIPPVNTLGYVNCNHFASDEQDFLTLAPVGLGLSGSSPVGALARANRTFGGCNATGGSTGSTFQFVIFNDTTGTLLYANSSATEDSDIWIIGYVDTLNS